MAGERIKLEVKPREARGSAESRRLRAAGRIPGVLYGGGKNPHPFTVQERDLRRVLTGDHGLHAILDVVFDGQKTAHHAVLKEYQLDPVRTRLLHIDLHEVRLDQPIQAQVVVDLVGESEGVKEGGVLTQVTREVNVEALPMEVPDKLELDISPMVIGDSMRVADLRVPQGVTLLDDPEETVLATVTPPTKVELPEEVVEEEEAELVEGEVPEEELPEGAEAPAEPEAEAAGEEQTPEG
jgi:large subunit ribosomal protein L25